MKLFTILLSFLSTLCISFAQQQIWITGTIDHFDQGDISVNFYDNMLSRQARSYQTQTDEKGHFSLNFELDQPLVGSIHFRDKTMGLYMIPGDTIRISFNHMDYDKSLTIGGRATHEMHYFIQFWKNFYTDTTEEDYWKSLGRNDYQLHQDFLYERLNAQRDFLAIYHEKHPLSEHFRKRELDKYAYLFAKDSYGSSNYYMNMHARDTTGNMPPLPVTYYRFLDEVKINNEDALLLRAYVDFITIYLSNKYYMLVKEAGEEDGFQEQMPPGTIALMNTAKTLFTGKVRDFMIADLIRNMIDGGNFELVKAEYNRYLAGDGDPLYKEILKNRKKVYAKLKAGQMAPPFSLPNPDGNLFSLKDYKGKVVYIDFWASWCGPCIAEFPKAEELKKRFSDNEEVVFINVSIDESIQDWKDALDEHQPKGINLLADENTQKEYLLLSIPRYMIIHRDGTIDGESAPRPSDMEVVVEAINEALQKGN